MGRCGGASDCIPHEPDILLSRHPDAPRRWRGLDARTQLFKGGDRKKNQSGAGKAVRSEPPTQIGTNLHGFSARKRRLTTLPKNPIRRRFETTWRAALGHPGRFVKKGDSTGDVKTPAGCLKAILRSQLFFERGLRKAIFRLISARSG